MSARDERQMMACAWAGASFGEEHCMDTRMRAMRFIEEAIELAQAMGLEKEMIGKLADHIYGKEGGEIYQEIGGVGVTLLVLAQSVGLSADACEMGELRRVIAKGNAHFAERNKEKMDAGFK